MNIVTILILASLGVALAFLGFFIWAVRNGQYEATLTPSMRVLADDERETHARKEFPVAVPMKKIAPKEAKVQSAAKEAKIVW
jgi:cbb3-type cytochrome oxidase maturation protein